MAKAQIRTPEGIAVNLDGTPEEIVAIVRDLKAQHIDKSTIEVSQKIKPGKGSLGDLITTLADGAFFKAPQDLAAIKTALAEMGHHYPVTTLSPVMIRLVRKRILRRMKQDKRWVYIRGQNFQ